MSTTGFGGHAALAVLAMTVAVLASDDRSEPTLAFTFQDPDIVESSALVDVGRTVLTVNDSGSDPVLYRVDQDTGETVGRTTFASEVLDPEGLAVAPGGTVWVGDIGDNGANRPSVAVYSLPDPETGDTTVSAQRYDLAYPGGPRDAEALLADPESGRLYVVSKGLLGGQVFAAPTRLQAGELNVLEPVGSVDGIVTDGGFLPDGKHVVLRTYSVATVYETEQWRSGATMALPNQPQGEGLAVSGRGERVLVSTEGERTDVYSVPLTDRMLEAVEPAPATEPPVPPETGPRQPGQLSAPPPDESGWYDVVGWSVLGALLLGAAWLGVRGALRRRQSRSTT